MQFKFVPGKSCEIPGSQEDGCTSERKPSPDNTLSFVCPKCGARFLLLLELVSHSQVHSHQLDSNGERGTVVSLPTWNCAELAQLDMSSQLMLPKPFSHPWYCHTLITVTPCCQGFLNTGIPQQLIEKLRKVQNCSA